MVKCTLVVFVLYLLVFPLLVCTATGNWENFIPWVSRLFQEHWFTILVILLLAVAVSYRKEK